MAPSPLPAAFALLAREKNAAVDAALVEALPDLDGEALGAAFAMLVGRGDVPSLAAVVGRYTQSSRALQRLILKHVRHLFAAVRQVIDSPVFEERAGAIHAVVHGRTGELAYLLADALRSRCAKTRELAAVGLYDMTERWLEQPQSDDAAGDTPEPSGQTDYLTQALRTGVMSWEIHLQPKVLVAAAWMADRLTPAIREKLEEPRTKIAYALNDILAGASDPRLAGFALYALAMPELRTSAARAIGGARDPAFIHAVLSQGRLLANPDIHRGCRWIRDSRWLHKGVDELLTLEGQEAVTAVRLIDATGGSHERKIEVYDGLLGTGDDDLRQAVVWQLVADPSQAASDLLSVVAGRGSDDLARIAARELQRRQSGGTTEPSSPGTPADTADGSPARRAFERFWEQFGEVTSEESSSSLETIQASGGDLIVFVRAKLASANPVDRARALHVAQSLEMLGKLEEQVYGAAHDPDPLVRSLAVGMLANLPGPTSLRILRAVVDDTDSRVQANAIEALDKLDLEERIAVTEAKLDSSNSRVRANAVKSLLRVELRRAGETLLDMLEDPSRAHRLSALWVVGRLQLSAVLHRIDDITRNDPDERVKQRAKRVLRDLSCGADVPGEPPESLMEPLDRRRVGGAL